MKKIVLVSLLILFIALPILGCDSGVTNEPSQSTTITITAQPLFPEPHLLFTAATVLLGIALLLVTRIWRNWLRTSSAISRWRWLHLGYQVIPVAAATLLSALAAIFIYPIMIGFPWGRWTGIFYGHAKPMVFIGLCALTFGLIIHGFLALRSVIQTKVNKETEHPDDE